VALPLLEPGSEPDDHPRHERPKNGQADADQNSGAAVSRANSVSKPSAETCAGNHGCDDPDPDFPLPHAEYPDIPGLRGRGCPAYAWPMTSTSPPAGSAAVRLLLDRHPVIDGHNDLPWALRQAGSLDPAKTDISVPVEFTHTDLPRLAKGGVGAQ